MASNFSVYWWLLGVIDRLKCRLLGHDWEYYKAVPGTRRVEYVCKRSGCGVFLGDC